MKFFYFFFVLLAKNINADKFCHLSDSDINVLFPFPCEIKDCFLQFYTIFKKSFGSCDTNHENSKKITNDQISFTIESKLPNDISHEQKLKESTVSDALNEELLSNKSFTSVDSLNDPLEVVINGKRKAADDEFTGESADENNNLNALPINGHNAILNSDNSFLLNNLSDFNQFYTQSKFFVFPNNSMCLFLFLIFIKYF